MEKPLETPDITPAQIKAGVMAVVGVSAALGLPVSQETTDHLLVLSGVLPAVVYLADAIIRHGRAKIAARTISDEELGLR